MRQKVSAQGVCDDDLSFDNDDNKDGNDIDDTMSFDSEEACNDGTNLKSNATEKPSCCGGGDTCGKNNKSTNMNDVQFSQNSEFEVTQIDLDASLAVLSTLGLGTSITNPQAQSTTCSSKNDFQVSDIVIDKRKMT